MKQMTGRNYGTVWKKYIVESYRFGQLSYQEIKTEWSSKKRKVSWVMPYKPKKNNNDGK